LKIVWCIPRERNLASVTEFVEPGADSYEYGIVYVRAPNEPHRAGMTKSEADKWIAEWRQDGGRDIFRVIRRWLGPWELLGEITVDDRDIETIVFESLGEVSTCWDPSTGDAVFDSTRARAIGDRLLAEIRARIVGDRSDELREQRDTARSQRAALAQRCERLDERRHELHDLLTVVETERDRLRAVVDIVRDAFLRPSDDEWKIDSGALVVLADALNALDGSAEATDG
jgi:hypothetical protein